MGAVCMALEQTKLGTGIRYEDIQALNLYWSQVRLLYGCFEANVRASDSSVFDHEMPGGQYTNLMVLLRSLCTSYGWLTRSSESSSKHRNWVWEHNGPVGLILIRIELPSIMTFTVIKQKYIEANELVRIPPSYVEHLLIIQPLSVRKHHQGSDPLTFP